ncbi:MAG: hypothetical protein ABJP45_07360, partial [Cyclobacteriaceae bacterium]
NELPKGTWNTYDSKGRIATTEKYEKGKLHGVATSYEGGKKSSETEYRFGKKFGPHKEYFPNGDLKIQANYELNLFHGTYTQYHKNGQIEFSGLYVRNKRHKIWTYFDKKGKKTEEITYQYGDILERK